MQNSKSSLCDLKNQFALKTEVSNNQIPPTLIYTNTRKKTMTALKVLNTARGVSKGEFNPKSPFARRFHSNTGPTDKTTAIADYAKGVYPVITCTLALGLGQNWTRVRQVIQMGRVDAAAVSQIIGRCGRNGNQGLAVFYVEKYQNKGKNSVSDFDGLTKFTDDDLMDGLAVTPVCLRIAFALSNLMGRIPMRTNEDIYMQEKARQAGARMCACRCSNCEREASKVLAANIKWLTISNFDAAMKDLEFLAALAWNKSNNEVAINEEIPTETNPDAPIVNQKVNGPPPRRIELMQLAHLLICVIEEHHRVLMDDQDRLKPSDYVDDNDIWRILNKIYTIQTVEDVYEILGCDILPGGVKKIFNCIFEWKSGSVGVQAINEMRVQEAATRVKQAETLLILQKQHEEREVKAQEACTLRTLKENQQKRRNLDRLAETTAKKQQKEESNKRKASLAKAKADQELARAKNARMIAALASGKTMIEVEAAEEKIRSQNPEKENESGPSNNI
ncbi:hypothetical protein DFH28DRAFT_919178 [Melampsora americana]|nr:hypothetical protein DFH28DRAFT_919178 [Melampsora americana]